MQRFLTYYPAKFRKYTIFLRTSRKEDLASDRAALLQVLFAGEYDDLLGDIRPGDIVLDCGANIGCFTIPAAIRVGPEGMVVAVEPDPENARSLRYNINANGLQNVLVEEKVLGGVSNQIRRFSPGGVMARVDPEGILHLDSTTLPGLLRQHSISAPSVIKMDVEGSELSIMADHESRGVVCASRSVAIEVHSLEAELVISEALEAAGATVRGPFRESDYLTRLLSRVFRHPYMTSRLYGLDAIAVASRVLKGVAKRGRSGVASRYEAGVISATHRPEESRAA